MAEHRAFGQPGGTTGVKQPGEIVLIRAHRRCMRLAARDQFFIGKRIRRAIADHHNMLNGCQFRPDLADGFEVFQLHQQYGRRAVVQDVNQFPRGETVVEENEPHARTGHTVIGLGIFRAVPRQNRDPITRFGQRQQRIGQLPAAVAQLRKGPAPVLKQKCGFVRGVMGRDLRNIADEHGCFLDTNSDGARSLPGRLYHPDVLTFL